jgi:hypothetical protein
MGSTEGNLYALWNARDYLDGNALVRDDISSDASCRTTYIRATPPRGQPDRLLSGGVSATADALIDSAGMHIPGQPTVATPHVSVPA